jgi:hypothetical protein
MQNVQIITALDAVTATVTSNEIYIGGFKRVALLFRRADDAGGTSAFTVKAGFAEAGTDPTMTAYNMLIDNVTNTNAQNYTRVNGKSIAASNGDVMLWMDPACPATHITVTVTETTDGTHSAYVIGFSD